METVTVYTTYDDMEAEILRNLLESSGIECQVISAIAHSVFPFTHDDRLAKININVSEQEAHRAEEIIADFLDSSEFLFNGDEMPDDDDDFPDQPDQS